MATKKKIRLFDDAGNPTYQTSTDSNPAPTTTSQPTKSSTGKIRLFDDSGAPAKGFTVPKVEQPKANQPANNPPAKPPVQEQPKKSGGFMQVIKDTGTKIAEVGKGVVEGITNEKIKFSETAKPTVGNFFARDFAKGVANIPGAFVNHLESWAQDLGKLVGSGSVNEAQEYIVKQNNQITRELTTAYRKQTDPVKKQRLLTNLQQLQRSQGELLKTLDLEIPSNKQVIADTIGAVADVAFLTAPIAKGLKSPLAKVTLADLRFPAAMATQRMVDYVNSTATPDIGKVATEGITGAVEGVALGGAGRAETFGQRTLLSGGVMGGIGAYEGAKQGQRGGQLVMTTAQNMAFGLAMPYLFGDRPGEKRGSFLSPDEQRVITNFKSLFHPPEAVSQAYGVLGLNPTTATRSQLDDQYRALAHKYHPDKLGETPDTGKFQELQQSYETAVKYDTSMGGIVANTKARIGEAVRSAFGSPRRLPAGAVEPQSATTQKGVELAKGSMVTGANAGEQSAAMDKAMSDGLTYSPTGSKLSKTFIDSTVEDVKAQITDAKPGEAVFIKNETTRQAVLDQIDQAKTGSYSNIADLVSGIDKVIPSSIKGEGRSLMLRQIVGEAPALLADEAMRPIMSKQLFDTGKPAEQQTTAPAVVDQAPNPYVGLPPAVLKEQLIEVQKNPVPAEVVPGEAPVSAEQQMTQIQSAVHDFEQKNQEVVYDDPATSETDPAVNVSIVDYGEGQYGVSASAKISTQSIVVPYGPTYPSRKAAINAGVQQVQDFIVSEKPTIATKDAAELERISERLSGLINQIKITSPKVSLEKVYVGQLGIERANNLSIEERKIEAAAATHAEANIEALYGEYKKKFGKVLNTDNVRELFAAYNASKETRSKYSAAVHEPSSALVKEFYKRELVVNQGAGNNTVMFTAGGTGAGKSTATEKVIGGEVYDAYPVVYDTNLASFKSSIKKIDQALAAGFDVDIYFTHRDPIDALVNGALPRAERMGRTVPLPEHLKTHVESPKVFQQITEHYKNDDRVQTIVIDNTRGKGQAVAIDKLPEAVYNPTVTIKQLEEALYVEYKDGKISEATYRGTLRELSSEAPGADQGRSKGTGRQPEQAGGRGKQVAVADEAYQATVKNGGVTISLEGNKPTTGIAYAPFKNTELQIPKGEFTPEIVQRYMDEHADELSQPGNHVGIWESDGKIFLDISRVGDLNSDTLNGAMDSKQLAAFDLSTFTEIPLGKMEGGVYTPLYDKASDHPYLNQGKNSEAGLPGTENKPSEISAGRESVSAEKAGQEVIPAEEMTVALGERPNSDTLKKEVETKLNKTIDERIAELEKICS